VKRGTTLIPKMLWLSALQAVPITMASVAFKKLKVAKLLNDGAVYLTAPMYYIFSEEKNSREKPVVDDY